jgi:hypothetical protein
MAKQRLSTLPKFVSFEHLREIELSAILPEEAEDEMGYGYLADGPSVQCMDENCAQIPCPMIEMEDGLVLCERCLEIALEPHHLYYLVDHEH